MLKMINRNKLKKTISCIKEVNQKELILSLKLENSLKNNDFSMKFDEN